MGIKWKKFIPHLRVLPEDVEGDVSSDNNSSIEEHIHHDDSKSIDDDKYHESHVVYAVDTSSNNANGKSSLPINSAHGSVKLQKGIPYELRDEANKSRWKFFDEYEYRLNKEYRKSRKWYEFLYPNHISQSKAERRLLYKLDIIVALYFLIVNWSRSVDSSNYTNAYVSHMKEDLHFKGNDYIYTSTIANVGSIVFQLPFIYILPRFPAHYVLPIMDFGWSWFTFACYRAKSLPELRAYRFILSSFGAAYYPVAQYLMGCWYAPDEISSRVCLFFCGQLLGSVTSGLLQARIFKSLNGVHGLAGWRWMFLIDAIAISIPTAILGFFVIPGIPSKCYSLFLTDEEIRIARARNKRNQIVDGVDRSKLPHIWSWKVWKKVIFTPTFWVLVIFDLCSWNNMTAYSGSYTLWLKSNTSYSIEKVNNLSVLPACLGFAFVFFCAFGADLFRNKWPFMVFSQCMNCISCAILIKWDVASSTKWFAFLITYFSVAASPCLWSFINDFLRHDPQVKAITWIAIYSISQSTYAWIPTLTWKTVDAPRFKTGYIASLIFSAIYGLWTFVVLFFYKRNEKKNALGNGIILYNSSKGESPPTFVETDMVLKNGYYYVKEDCE